LRVLLLMFILQFVPLLTAHADGNLSRYRIGSGDMVEISVFNEEELTTKSRLSDTGSISFPLLGEVKISGMTIGEMEAHVVSLLKGEDKYLIDPKVTVSIIEYRQIFVTGEVEKPGSYDYIPGLTVRKAISIAGGMTRRASEDKIYIINDTDPSEQQNRVSLKDLVQAGDTITVDESFF
jgi:polysaccharide biosynthesis/export protein VpsN